MGDIQVHVIVRGRVQRVGFRNSLQRQAELRSVRGWVRNLPDGTVEAVLQGDDEAVHSVVDWTWRGPRGASVHDVESTEGSPTESFPEFEIRE